MEAAGGLARLRVAIGFRSPRIRHCEFSNGCWPRRAPGKSRPGRPPAALAIGHGLLRYSSTAAAAVSGPALAESPVGLRRDPHRDEPPGPREDGMVRSSSVVGSESRVVELVACLGIRMSAHSRQRNARGCPGSCGTIPRQLDPPVFLQCRTPPLSSSRDTLGLESWAHGDREVEGVGIQRADHDWQPTISGCAESRRHRP